MPFPTIHYARQRSLSTRAIIATLATFGLLICLIALTALPGCATLSRHTGNHLNIHRLPWVGVSADGHSFQLKPSGTRFVPWGVNYDHDENSRLLEDYWQAEWPKVEQDFGEMKTMGVNVVRIHLQVARFMNGPETPNREALDQLSRLVALAERTGLYLDLTGLACYRKSDVPPWFDKLPEQERWAVQARFWEAVASRCAGSPAVFCYDLINEPVVAGAGAGNKEWLSGEFGGFCYVQFISLDPGQRTRPDVAIAWIDRMTAAIRKHDRRHMITVGLVPWSLNRPGLTSGFEPDRIAPHLDFICIHMYPDKGKLNEAMDTLRGFAVGKPLLIEEMFFLNTSVEEFEQFLDASRAVAAGWVGFYWGKTLEECRRSGDIGDAMEAQFLELFIRKADAMKK